jgi:AraC-like DNA-binding protein
MSLIQADLSRNWTVENLAQELSMSHSAFAARFAAQADALGYRSEAAFSRAFKRVLGALPA